MKKLSEEKVMRDPIHGYIHVRLQIIWDCINAPEFQRLRRIHQLGATYQVYHTAEHSRFSHSLGVYEIVRRMIKENAAISRELSDYDKLTVLLAGLLHDIGHGPFSHCFERWNNKTHEEYTCNLIEKPSTINTILLAENPNLPTDVANIIRHRHPNKLLTQMISSQLDADRMDYLLRDAYFTGTSYGEYDIERVLRTLSVKDHRLVVKESGVHTIEDYIMARYHMYWQVYFHPVSRSFEALLIKLFERIRDIYQNDEDAFNDYPMFLPLIEKGYLDNEEFIKFDECTVLYGFSYLREYKDNIIQDLADRILNRRLFGYDNIYTIEQENDYYNWIRNNGYDADYYMYIDRTVQRPYQPYDNKATENSIWVLMQNGTIVELSEASTIVSAILNGKEKDENKVFYPKELNQ